MFCWLMLMGIQVQSWEGKKLKHEKVLFEEYYSIYLKHTNKKIPKIFEPKFKWNFELQFLKN